MQRAASVPRRQRVGGWRRSGFGVALLGASAVSLASLSLARWPFPNTWTAPSHFADATDTREVIRGKLVYKEQCASCHGRALQGQPLWQLNDEFTHRRAPALDQTGRAWLLADEALFMVTKFGRSADQSAPTPSGMPAFKDVLDDRDILAVIAFIKARWPVGLRVLQAARNPDYQGMPANSDRAGWVLPPDCMPGRPTQQ